MLWEPGLSQDGPGVGAVAITAMVSAHDLWVQVTRRPMWKGEASPEGPGRGDRQPDWVDTRAQPTFLGEMGLKKTMGGGRKGLGLGRKSLHFWAVRGSCRLATDRWQAMTSRQFPAFSPL